MNFLDYLVDPVVRGPTIASMLMSLTSALIGVIPFLKKRSLIGEALSHSAYPGIVLSVVALALFSSFSENSVAIGILIGAFLSALLGLYFIDLLEKHLKISDDAALCFVLSIFFGVGVLIASRIQVSHSLLYKQIQLFLYGQAATMTDAHIFLYGTLCLFAIIFVTLLYRLLQIVNFDRQFAKSIGIWVKGVEFFSFFLLIFAIVIGMRSVGVVLMSGMLIAPAVAARQWTNQLSHLFAIAGAIGLCSGFLGNFFSLEIPKWLGIDVSLPTGPMILLTSSFICFFSLFFAPKEGLVNRAIRIYRFQRQCIVENLLKTLWKRGEGAVFSSTEMKSEIQLYALKFRLLVFLLIHQGWLMRIGRDRFALTKDGFERARRIIRLHRLWEVYLVSFLGQGVERVHKSAEEMEHILTPDLERQLTELLNDPKKDPHNQPIPKQDLS